MIRALLALVRAVFAVFRKAWLYELAGAGLVTAGVYQAWGVPAALGASGAAFLLKSVELDSRGDT